MKALLSVASFAALSLASANAQVTVIASESFDYPTPGLILNQSGGTGWNSPWDSPSPGDGIVIFDTTINPPMTCANTTNSYAGQAIEFVPVIRSPNFTPHQDILDGAFVGADGATIWISFRTQQYQFFGDSFGALQLFQSNNTTQEQLLLGSPWATNSWGIDDDAGTGLDPEFVASSNAAVCADLVFRIDHLPGDERVQMWIDPAVPYPTTPADLDTFITDLRWDEIRLNSGGSGTHFFWDNIEIAKGEPTLGVGMSYCGPANLNSAGLSGTLIATGSTVVSDNALSLTTTNLPAFSFGFSIVSQTQAFIMNPGGSAGNLCVSGSIGRYVGPGQIMNSGAAGEFTLALDLTSVPQPTGPVSVNVGETWNFQSWYRDTVGMMATSNFTDGVSIVFQ